MLGEHLRCCCQVSQEGLSVVRSLNRGTSGELVCVFVCFCICVCLCVCGYWWAQGQVEVQSDFWVFTVVAIIVCIIYYVLSWVPDTTAYTKQRTVTRYIMMITTITPPSFRGVYRVHAMCIVVCSYGSEIDDWPCACAEAHHHQQQHRQ